MNNTEFEYNGTKWTIMSGGKVSGLVYDKILVEYKDLSTFMDEAIQDAKIDMGWSVIDSIMTELPEVVRLIPLDWEPNIDGDLDITLRNLGTEFLYQKCLYPLIDLLKGDTK